MLAWYGSLHPLKVDVVGDFAGKELFAIHSDSMLPHCITKVKGGLRSYVSLRQLSFFTSNVMCWTIRTSGNKYTDSL